MKLCLKKNKNPFVGICCKLLLISLLVCGISGCSGEKKAVVGKAKAKVVFRTEPAGAAIFIAGRTVKKVTPAEYSLTPGTYVVKFSLSGYKTEWKKAEFKKGKTTIVECSLVPLRSCLLVAAKADGKYGVQVQYKGKIMGETPLVLRDLPLGKGEILLIKKGYSPVRESFTIQDALPPPAIVTELSSNRGGLFVSSVPSSAEVFLNGESVGQTPLRMPVSEGQHKLEIVKNGYTRYVRDIDIVRKKDTRVTNIKLAPLPAVLYVKSTPQGGKLYINDVPRGDANGSAITLEPGKYKVRVEKDGFDDDVQEIVLRGGEKKHLTMKLDTVMGALEIFTRPAGVSVFVDGKLVGRSKPDPANPKFSEVVRVSNLRQGKHTVTIAHKRARKPRSGKLTVEVNVKKGQTTRVDQIELWVPDIKIILKSGGFVEGKFVNYTPEGIRYEPQPGLRYVHKNEYVLRVEKLPLEDE